MIDFYVGLKMFDKRGKLYYIFVKKEWVNVWIVTSDTPWGPLG
jgi:hypothetical protein